MRKYEVLKQYFGYTTFRDGQEFVIDNILNKNDICAIMPTGAGKSLCFQVPALMFSGITIVVSPLISLMKDQVSTLKEMGVSAAFLNSSLTQTQFDKALSNARKNLYKIIYVAPERLLSFDFLDFATNSHINMLTIDEAHCISQWGQDFRPSYLKIPEFLNKLPIRPIVSAFTATATEEVKQDIIVNLKLKNPKILVTGFDRKNLFFEVKKQSEKFKSLMAFLSDKSDKSGIIYCITRKLVEEVCQKLNDNGITAVRYHAGLSDHERHKNQDAFIFDEVNVMVATNAFGMGIDKSNVSFVVHYNMPKNIESYYQEAGRAGRDGSFADCLLLFDGSDIRVNNFLIENGREFEFPDKETEKAVIEKDKTRLKKMINYCYSSNCLRQFILNYFGEKTGDNCQNCGNCLGNYENIDITIDSQKVLSCVKRVGESFEINVICDVLQGVTSETVINNNLDKVKTFGIMEHMETKKIKNIIYFLYRQDYLFISEDKILNLTDKSNKILFDNEVVKMKVVSDKKPEEPVTSSYNNYLKSSYMLNTANEELLAKLKKLRLEIAREEKIPAYHIFSDATLLDMCQKHPKSESELLGVNGVGNVKLEKFGDRFLNLLRDNL